jgi:short-subunit dehydrogenase
MPRKVTESVVVITGASSGIGRATALEFARRGAFVVGAARSADTLQEVIEACQRLGSRSLAIPTDMTDPDAVQALAQQAAASYGRIDVWVNNAAVTLFGRLEETPLDAYRRVIDTNILGYVHGARAVLPYFREQGEGVLINVSSVAGKIGQPYTSAYITTKFAICGLSESLRQEVRDTNMHVCTVLPATIDTPIFQHGANFFGRTASAMPPVYPPERVAARIVRLAEKPQREVFVGRSGRLFSFLHTTLPGLAERMMATQVEKKHFQDKPCEPSRGNLFEPMPQENRIHGGWSETDGGARRRFMRAGLVVSIPLVAGGIWYWYRHQSRRKQIR